MKVLLRAKEVCKLIKIGTLLAVSAALTSCASQQLTQVSQPEATWVNHYRPKLESLKSWTANGYWGVRSPQKTLSGNVEWTYNGPDNYTIELYGPLGLDDTTIQKIPGQPVVLDNDDQGHFYAPTSEALMDKALGWSVPLEGLAYWMRGLPEPSSRSTYTLNQFGLVQTLFQLGWRIDYVKYAFFGDKYPLPTTLVLTRENMLIKIHVNDWSLPGSC